MSKVNIPQTHAFFAFPTVCYNKLHGDLGAFNRDLAALVRKLSREQEGKTHGVSVKEGYHSQTDFFQHDHPLIHQLKQIIATDVEEYLEIFWKSASTEPMSKYQPFNSHLWGWTVILREGAFSSPHIHPNAAISGVYYVEAPEGADLLNTANRNGHPGWLALKDPRPSAAVNMLPGQSTSISVAPLPGSIVVFPSYLEHYVPPFKGPGERISIAFNLRFTGAAGAVRNA